MNFTFSVNRELRTHERMANSEERHSAGRLANVVENPLG